MTQWDLLDNYVFQIIPVFDILERKSKVFHECLLNDSVHRAELFLNQISQDLFLQVHHNQSSWFSWRIHSKAAIAQSTWVDAVPFP